MSWADAMSSRLPSSMTMPEPFEALLRWIEAQGFLADSHAYPGDRVGSLALLATEEPYIDIGTVILFRTATQEQAKEFCEAWCGRDIPDIAERLVPFARTGSDGSHVAFWIDELGHQQIVHLGSEGDTGILVATPLDFLRLLAIGYEEISGDCRDAPDEPPDDQDEERIIDNKAYRNWLIERYNTTIPRVAAEVMLSVTHSLASESSDSFLQWVRKHQR